MLNVVHLYFLPIESVEAKIYTHHLEWRHEYVVVRFLHLNRNEI